MKAAALTIALLMSSASFAQTADLAYDGDGVVSTAYEAEEADALAATSDAMTDTGITDATSLSMAVSQPGNSAPERDARGIAVISDPAVVPAGWNGTAAGAAMGGPELNAAGEPVAPDSYPACTATVTDNCLQTYERGRKD